jgi:hypothetical protein
MTEEWYEKWKPRLHDLVFTRMCNCDGCTGNDSIRQENRRERREFKDHRFEMIEED